MEVVKKHKAYIEGNMTEEAMDLYTSKIVKDYVEDQNRKKRWSEIIDEKHDLSHLKEEPKANKRNGRNIIVTSVSIAASLLFVYFVFESFEQNQLQNNNQLVEQYLKDPFPYAFTRKSPQDIPSIRRAAGEAYGMKNYQSAIEGFTKIISSPEVNSSDFFYLGLSHLYLNDSNKAIANFKKSQSKNSELFKKEVKWYLALAYFQSKDYENSKLLLEEIVKWKEITNARGWDKEISRQAEALLRIIE